ncbi:hypothetical protein AMTRI_Chr04g247160 [Amborella trichopoda]
MCILGHLASMTSQTPTDPNGASELRTERFPSDSPRSPWEMPSISFKGACTNALWLKVLFSQNNYPLLMPSNSSIIFSFEMTDSSIPMFLVALLLKYFDNQ